MDKASCACRVLASVMPALMVSAHGGGGDDGVGSPSDVTALERTLQEASESGSAWPRYRVQELRAPGEGNSADAALNERLQVLGSSDTDAGEPHATRFGHGAQAGSGRF